MQCIYDDSDKNGHDIAFEEAVAGVCAETEVQVSQMSTALCFITLTPPLERVVHVPT